MRDIGTRFEVQIQDGGLRVRVRLGAVRLELAFGGNHDLAAGREVLALAGRSIVDQPVSTFGADWDWIIRVTPFRLEGATLEQFFTWVETEGGRTIEVRDPRLRASAAGIVLHGSIQGLSMEEALRVALPAAGLRATLVGSQVIVDRAADGAMRP